MFNIATVNPMASSSKINKACLTLLVIRQALSMIVRYVYSAFAPITVYSTPLRRM